MKLLIAKIKDNYSLTKQLHHIAHSLGWKQAGVYAYIYSKGSVHESEITDRDEYMHILIEQMIACGLLKEIEMK